MAGLLTNKFERPVFARARALCLAFPETAETVSWGHPNFRAGKKTFCAMLARSYRGVANKRMLRA